MGTEHKNRSRKRVLGVLRRGVPWILLCVAFGAGVAYTITKYQKKKYTATAFLLFNNSGLPQEVTGSPAAHGSVGQRVQPGTSLKLSQRRDIAARTARQLRRGVTGEDVSRAVSVSAQGASNIVLVSATVTSPGLAAEIANTYATQFVKQQLGIRQAYYSAALKTVSGQVAALSQKERNGAAGLALRNRVNSLRTVGVLRDVGIAQAAAVPDSPSSPAVSRSTVIGALLGFVLGLGGILLFARFDRRIREPEDLVAIYRLPLLGVVPDSPALSHLAATASRSARDREKALPALQPDEAEAFPLIRARMRYLDVGSEIQTVVVTSALHGDGTTTVAAQLAIAAARAGEVVLLIEADLRRPTLARQLDAQPGPGLSDVLIGVESLWSATQPVELNRGSRVDSPARMPDEGWMRSGLDSTGSGGQSLDLLVAGNVPSNPGELIETAAMEALLERAKSTYDLVVIDTTPLTVVSDAFPLLRKVDGVIVVGRLGHTGRDAAVRLSETLSVAGGRLLGVVANCVKVDRRGSYADPNEYAYVEPERVPTAAVSANGASSEQPTFGTWI